MRRAPVEQARDVRVLETREDLPLGPQATADERRAGPAVHELDGHLLLVFIVDTASLVDLAHAADTDFFDELIGAATAPDHIALEGLETQRRVRRNVQEPVVGVTLRREQRLHFVAKPGIGGTQSREQRCALGLAEAQRVVQCGFDLLPALGRHARKATRAQRAQSKHQVRLTTTSCE